MKKIFFLAMCAALAAAGAWIWKPAATISPVSQPAPQSIAGGNTEKNLSAPRADRTPENPAPSTRINITLVVGASTYQTGVSAGATLYDAMNAISSSTSLAFKSKYYSGLGYMIETINGTTNAGGAYWTLYVNGTLSEIGASQYALKEGDTVEWRYEKL